MLHLVHFTYNINLRSCT